LPLDQPQEPTGGINDPVMICPMCNDEYRATGMKWTGAYEVPGPEASEEEVWRWAYEVADAMRLAVGIPPDRRETT
jgi:hypothetical protein